MHGQAAAAATAIWGFATASTGPLVYKSGLVNDGPTYSHYRNISTTSISSRVSGSDSYEWLFLLLLSKLATHCQLSKSYYIFSHFSHCHIILTGTFQTQFCFQILFYFFRVILYILLTFINSFSAITMWFKLVLLGIMVLRMCIIAKSCVIFCI